MPYVDMHNRAQAELLIVSSGGRSVRIYRVTWAKAKKGVPNDWDVDTCNPTGQFTLGVETSKQFPQAVLSKLIAGLSCNVWEGNPRDECCCSRAPSLGKAAMASLCA